MKNVLIVNGHQPHPVSPGGLNGAFVARATSLLQGWSHTVRIVKVAEAWDVEAEVDNQLWADLLVFQFPLNSMGVPWSLKRYLDEVYTAGMDGRLAHGDGRTRSDPSKQYGSGGRMGGTSYGLSVTLNAPRSAFCDPSQTLFGGRSLDDLLLPVHINFQFFGLKRLATFAAYDVSKNARIERDFERFDQHLSDILSA